MVDRTKEILKGAVATHLGWVNPKNGELLVSIRGLPGAVKWTRKDGIEELQKITKPEPIQDQKVAFIAPDIVNALAETHGLDAESEIKEILKIEDVQTLIKEDSPTKKPKKPRTPKVKKAAE